jgi:hypothetical protein
MTDDEIKVLISAEADQLKSGMDDAKGAVADATGGMKDSLGQLSSSTTSSTSQIADSFKEMHGQITSQLAQITATLGEVGMAFAGLASIFEGGALFKGVVDSFVNLNLEARKLGAQMGISMADAGGMIEAYNRVGVSSDTVSQALRMMERQLKTNYDAVANMTSQVGITINRHDDMVTTYFKVIEALKIYREGGERAQAGMTALGARVQNINSLLLVSKSDCESESEAMRRLGIQLGGDSLAQTRNFQKGMADVGLVMTAVKWKIANEILPIVISLGVKFVNAGATIVSACRLAASGIKLLIDQAPGLNLLVDALAHLGKAAPPSAMGGGLGKRGWQRTEGALPPSAMGGGFGAPPPWGTSTEEGATFNPLDKGKGAGGGGGPGLLAQWKDELEQLKTEQNAFLDFSKQAEKEFWQAKLTQCAEGSKEYLAVSREIYTIDKALAQDAAKEKIAALNRQMTSEKTDWDARKALMAQIVAFVKTFGDKQSSEYRDVLQRQEQFDQEYDKQQRTLAQSRLDNELKLGQMRIAAAQEEVKFKESMGQISASTAAAQETALTQQSLALEQRHIEQSKANWTGYYAEMQKLDQQEAEFKEKKLLEVQKANEQAVQKELQDIKSAIAPIDSAVSGMVSGFIQGTLTMRKAMQNMCMAILSAFVGAAEKMATTWIANQLQMLIYGKASQTAAAVGQITSDAAVAAAGAYASTAAIPIVGPEMAPAAAMEAYAAVMAFAGMASFDTGAWGIPRAGAALLHPGEAVLPATKASGLDRLIEGGGASGAGAGDTHVHLNITAFDGADVQRVLLNNPRALAAAITSLGRNFVPV